MESHGRRRRSKQERRQIVEETLKPGASVSRVARTHDINSNQLFHWRKQYREGLLDDEETSAGLLPVRISREKRSKVEPTAGRVSMTPCVGGQGRIEIDLGRVRVVIEGAADPDCVRAALEGLAR